MWAFYQEKNVAGLTLKCIPIVPHSLTFHNTSIFCSTPFRCIFTISHSSMEITLAYGIAAGSIFVIVILLNLLLKPVSLWISKHLTYPRLIDRHLSIGPWSRADVLLRLIYITENIVSFSFRTPSIWTAGLRAVNLLLINLIPVFADFYLSFLTDLFGVSLNMY